MSDPERELALKIVRKIAIIALWIKNWVLPLQGMENKK